MHLKSEAKQKLHLPQTTAPGKQRHPMATPGMICLFVLLSAGAAFGLARAVWDFDGFAARRSALAATCQNNLKQLGLALKMYANQSQGEQFPTLSSVEGNFMFREAEIFPRFVQKPEVLVCPGPAGVAPEDHFTDKYYVYTGYVLTNEEDLAAFVDAYPTEIANGGAFAGNLPGETSYGNSVLRIREGIERFIITDINNPAGSALAQSKLPVIWDWPDNHDAGYGGNVLYMDGHVEFVRFGDKFPMTQETLDLLADVAGYEPPTDWAPNHYREDYPYNTISQLPSQCQNNLKRIGLVNKMYANESQSEYLPPLSSEGGRLMCESDAVYPAYVADSRIYTCPGRAPSDPEIFFDDDHYVYLSHLMLTDGDVQQFAAAYPQVIASGGDFTENLEVESSYGDRLYRLREGIERFSITDINNPASTTLAQSKIPVVLEWPENHEGEQGGNVLFMDGHVEWMPYPGEFPMTEATITALRSVAQNSPATEWAIPDNVLRPDKYGYIGGCENHLKQWGLIDKMFANESSGQVFPPLSPIAGRLAPVDSSIFPAYSSSREMALCPGTADYVEDPEAFDDENYVYLGYVVQNDEDMQAFATAYAAEIAAGGDFSGNLDVETSYGDQLARLKEGILRFVITDINNPASPFLPQHKIPVMIEWPGNHEDYAGGHVLYMDGHVEWHDYPGEFPMTETSIGILDSIADWTPTTAWNIPRFPGPGDEYDVGLCGGNQRAFGLAMKIYAQTSDRHQFPPLSPEAGTLMMDDDSFFQYDLREMRRMNCPGSANAYRQPAADDHSYAYLGYVIRDQEELERFAAGYQAQTASGGDFQEHLDVGGEIVPRLREGIERFLITDINSPAAALFSQRNIPILVEWPDNHGNVRGGNVLYMDGHVAWLDYPSKFPMTEEAMAVLTELAGRGPIRDASAPAGQSRLDSLLQQSGP